MHGQRGSVLVEFVLVAPVLIFLLIATMVLGLTVNSKIVISGAAREGARAYAITRDASHARHQVREAVLGGGLRERYRGRTLFDAAQDVQISVSGHWVTVTVTYRQPTFVPFLPLLLDRRAGAWDDLVSLESGATMRIEGTGQ